MEPITIKLDSEFIEKLKARMVKKGCKTLSQCARELMDLAMRIEDAAQSDDAVNDDNGLSPELMELFKTNLIWSLETRFMLRFLLENWKGMESVNTTFFMEKAKERAANAVHEMFVNTKIA